MARERHNYILFIVLGSVIAAICALIAAALTLFIIRMEIDHKDYYDLELISESPDKSYTLEAYLVSSGGATVGFSQNVYLTDESGKKLIYDAYKENNIEIHWIDDSVVSINGRILDLSKGQTYNWKWENFVINTMFIKPFKALFGNDN